MPTCSSYYLLALMILMSSCFSYYFIMPSCSIVTFCLPAAGSCWSWSACWPWPQARLRPPFWEETFDWPCTTSGVQGRKLMSSGHSQELCQLSWLMIGRRESENPIRRQSWKFLFWFWNRYRSVELNWANESCIPMKGSALICSISRKTLQCEV